MTYNYEKHQNVPTEDETDAGVEHELDRVALHFTDGSTEHLTPENALAYLLNRRLNERLGEEDREEWLEHAPDEPLTVVRESIGELNEATNEEIQDDIDEIARKLAGRNADDYDCDGEGC